MNKLAGEASIYLRQHAGNPVDWHPWCEEAIERARAEDRPILLSIGYSSCHWCHVMAHESFADAATAAVMNERFVNIKVDREERPDLDRVYQLVHQLLNRQAGGWPLTAFLDAKTLLPFMSGTYFPRHPRHGLPGFNDLLLRIGDAYQAKREELAEQGKKLATALAQIEQGSRDAEASADASLAAAREQLNQQYDAVEGGFGRVPKFPMPAALDRLLRHWRRSRDNAGPRADQESLNMVMTTLTKMARGGIFDHLGGGFCRYSTDRRWAVPHFEKMLCDNGALLALYADALGFGGDPLFTSTVRETAAWLVREMQHPEGGFCTSQDADSEGEEGRFYLWRRDQVKRLLDEDEYLVVETLYGLDKPANFGGKWNLYRRDSWRAVAERLYLQPGVAAERLASARARLFAARAERPAPATDDKVLAGWNGLAIHGMASAGLRLDEADWIESASRATAFVRKHMVVDGRLRSCWHPGSTDGRAGPPGYLEDHANMLLGVLALLSARWRDEDMAFATFLGDELLNRFEDSAHGGFFFTAHDQEQVLMRLKPIADDALPPGNAIAARALIGLGRLAGESRYVEAAERALQWALGFAEQHPAGHCSLLTALEASEPAELVIIRGPDEAASEWLSAGTAGYHPQRAVYAIPYDAREVPRYLPRLVSADTRARVSAFICTDMRCGAPVTDLAAFKQAME